MKPWGALVVALSLVACGKDAGQKPNEPPKDRTLELKITQVPPEPGYERVVLDVVTEPGATVACYYPPNSNGKTVCPDVVADEAGKARLDGAWPGASRTQVLVTANVYGGKDGNGRGEVVFDVSDGRVFLVNHSQAIPEGSCVDHSCRFTIDGSTIAFTEIEAGAALEIGGKPVEVAADGTATKTFSDDELLGGVSVRRIADRMSGGVYVPVKLTWKDGTVQESTVAVQGGEKALWKRLAEVRKGGVTLPGDGDAALGTALAVVSIQPDAYIFHRLFGTANTFQDLGLVAVVAPKGQRKKSCGPYGDVRAKLEMTIANADVTVYDRKTGKQKARKTFTGGSAACPKEIEVTAIRDTYANALAYDMDEVNIWLSAMAK